MKNIGGVSGSRIPFVIADSTASPGSWRQVGQFFGIVDSVDSSTADGVGQIGDSASLLVETVVRGLTAAVTAAQGDALYYDAGAGNVTTDAVAGPFIGAAVDGFASGDGNARVRLNESAVDPLADAITAYTGKIKNGTVAVASGANHGTHAMGAGTWDGKPVVVTLQSAAGALAAAVVQVKAAIASGTLTVTLIDKDGAAVNAGSDLVFAFHVDAN